MTAQKLPAPLPHRDDCECECHGIVADDAECGYWVPACCYTGERYVPKRCGLCERSDMRLTECEGLMLCRRCRREIR